MCRKVYVPPRLVPDRRRGHRGGGRAAAPGIVTTFTVVNVQFYGQEIEVPYVCAVLLDGADIGLFGLVQEVPFDQVRMGMRVEAVWVPRRRDDDGPQVDQVLEAHRRARRRLRDLPGARLMPSRDVAVVAFAQSDHVRMVESQNEVEMVMPVLHQVKQDVGLDQSGIDFTCSGSTDYLAGSAFSFVMALDGVGAWPPISESHVEMDGAWALYEAWVKIQTGVADTALVFSYGKSSPGSLRDVLSRQLDPYYVAPLWPDAVGVAALQARACIDAGVTSVGEMADIAARSAGRPPPTRTPSCRAPTTPTCCSRSPGGGAAAPARLPADHRRGRGPDPGGGRPGASWPTGRPGSRASTIASRPTASASATSPTRRRPAWRARRRGRVGPGRHRRAACAVHHQEVVLAQALGLGDGVAINPSGGALAANPMMAAGLVRIGEAARRISQGEAGRAVAHATSGRCLQQNLVCVLEGDE